MARLWRIEFCSNVTKNELVASALQASPLGPKFGLGPSGLAIRASEMPQPPVFRTFNLCLAVSDVLRSTPTMQSVKELTTSYVYTPYV